VKINLKILHFTVSKISLRNIKIPTFLTFGSQLKLLLKLQISETIVLKESKNHESKRVEIDE
jgi:hypothetical protein